MLKPLVSICNKPHVSLQNHLILANRPVQYVIRFAKRNHIQHFKMSILQGRVFPLCYVYILKHGCFIVEALLQQRSENKGLRTAPSGSYRADVHSVCNHSEFFNYYEGMYLWNEKASDL